MLNPGTFIVNNLFADTQLDYPSRLRPRSNNSKQDKWVACERLRCLYQERTGILTPEPPYTTGSFTVSIAGNVLTITAVGAGVLNVGGFDHRHRHRRSTSIVAHLTGTIGGIGTYAVTPSGTERSVNDDRYDI